MCKKLFFTLCIMSLSIAAFAQSKNRAANKEHKIVFHLASEDTLVHKSLMKQLNNVLTAIPNSTIEVVCHGPGIYMIMRERTLVLDKIQALTKKSVTFKACENTLKERNIPKDKIIAEAGFVPSALVEIVLLQEKGWSYIKAGF